MKKHIHALIVSITLLATAANAAMQELSDTQLTDTVAQAAGADIENINVNFDKVDLSLLIKHADTEYDLAFVVTGLKGNIAIDRIGIDGATVGAKPALRLSFGTATVDGNGTVTSTTGATVTATNLGFDGLYITPSTGAFSDNATRNDFVVPKLSANPLMGLNMNGALKVYGAIKMFQSQ